MSEDTKAPRVGDLLWVVLAALGDRPDMIELTWSLILTMPTGRV